MSELPNGWATATVVDLIAADGVFADGDWVESKDQDPEGEIRLLQLADIGDGVFVDKSNRFVNDGTFERLRCTELFEGDVLIARMPDPLGRACLTPKLRQRCITVVDVAIVRPGPTSVGPKWLMHFLNAPPVRQLIELQSSGTTRRRISRGNLAQLDLPVPPLPEQKRIADKLDALLARVDACRDRLDRVPAILKRFRQSVLAAATTGDLTRDWREEEPTESVFDENSGTVPLPSSLPDLPPGWRWIPFGGLVSSLRSGTSMVPSDVKTAFPVLRSSSVRQRTLDLADVRYLRPDGPFRSADVLAEGDLLFTRLSGSLQYVANCVLVRDLGKMKGVQYPDRLFRAKLKDERLGPYVEVCFGSPALRAFLEVESKSTAGHQRVSMGAITGFPIPLPPPRERVEIVRRVDALLNQVDRLDNSCLEVTAKTNRLTSSALAKAFRGELVPQNPSDEPASALLARVGGDRGNLVGTTEKKRGANNGNRGPVAKSKATPKRGRPLKEAATQ